MASVRTIRRGRHARLVARRAIGVGGRLPRWRGRAAAARPTPAADRHGPTAAPPADRDQLAGLAAAAKDKRYVATYTLAVAEAGRPYGDRGLSAATAPGWSTIPAGALGGLADVAIVSTPAAGLFQCALGPAAGTAGARPDLGPVDRRLRQGGRAARRPPTRRVEHVFTDWIDAAGRPGDRAVGGRGAAAAGRAGHLLLGRVHLGRARAAGRPGRLLLPPPTAC